jgi:hypothetical protein
LLFIAQTSDKQTEIVFEINVNELYYIVQPAKSVGIFGQTKLVTLKMLDARPGFIIKFLKRSLIVNVYLKRELSTASLQFSTASLQS